jgi:hypothetical protein
VLEMTLDVPPDSTRVGPSRRVAPVDALRKRLDELACPQCVRDEEVQGGPPPTYSGCVSPMPARWYREEDECLRAAGPTGKPELDAATDPGHPVTDCVFNALTDEAVRQADLDDAAAYDETLRRVRAAEARADALLRAFASQIARTRQIFVREDGQSEGLCEVWSVRHDPGSPSGWISREERQDDGTRQVAEFRFAAQPYSVEMTGWKTTALPSSADVTSIADRGSLCTTLTTVVDVSAAQITFDDQTWYFSARACHAGAKTSRPDDGFGPRCHRSG